MSNQIFRLPCCKPGFINPFPQNDPDFILLVTPASRNVQDSPMHCFGLMLVHTKYFLNSPHSVFVHALLHLDSVPHHAAGLPTVCVTFFSSSAPWASFASLLLPLESSTFLATPLSSLSSEALSSRRPSLRSFTQAQTHIPCPMLARCPRFLRYQSLSLTEHLSLCIVISCLQLYLPCWPHIGTGPSFSLIHGWTLNKFVD